MRWPWARRTLSRAELGALGERHAARALRAAGLRLIEANFRVRQGELDLIARHGDVLVIVEVRTRTDGAFVTPLASVDGRKQAQLARMARRYLRARRLPECPIRFDVVEVLATPTGRITAVMHVPGAFVTMGD